MRPQRIQRKRIKGWRMPPNTVSVCRPGPWGNPFRPIDPTNPVHVAKAVAYFRAWLLGTDRGFDCGPEQGVTLAFIPQWSVPGNRRAMLPDLRGKNLACFCPIGSACHADVLLELANA